MGDSPQWYSLEILLTSLILSSIAQFHLPGPLGGAKRGRGEREKEKGK